MYWSFECLIIAQWVYTVLYITNVQTGSIVSSPESLAHDIKRGAKDNTADIPTSLNVPENIRAIFCKLLDEKLSFLAYRSDILGLKESLNALMQYTWKLKGK